MKSEDFRFISRQSHQDLRFLSKCLSAKRVMSNFRLRIRKVNNFSKKTVVMGAIRAIAKNSWPDGSRAMAHESNL